MKTIKAEILMIEGAPFPVIKEYMILQMKGVMGTLHRKLPLLSPVTIWIC